MEHDLIVLYDMDGTLFDYEKALASDLKKLASPGEKTIRISFGNNPLYLRERIDLITSNESWWENLPKFQLGWDVLKITQELGYYHTILTQGPRKKPAAWSGKKKCVDKHFGENFDVILTRNKGLIYGKVLVDDFPGYIEKWLKWRKNGQVIMPANEYNKDFKHSQVIRYDGNNLNEVRDALEKVKRKTLGKKN
jgi:5'-nucleotidase